MNRQKRTLGIALARVAELLLLSIVKHHIPGRIRKRLEIEILNRPAVLRCRKRQIGRRAGREIGKPRQCLSYRSGSTANKASELSDFSVCTTWGIRGKDLYLLHVLRRRMEYPELKRAVREQCEAFAASVVLIEDKASGTQLIRAVPNECSSAVPALSAKSCIMVKLGTSTPRSMISSPDAFARW
jgi:hypothetical protein